MKTYDIIYFIVLFDRMDSPPLPVRCSMDNLRWFSSLLNVGPRFNMKPSWVAFVELITSINACIRHTNMHCSRTYLILSCIIIICCSLFVFVFVFFRFTSVDSLLFNWLVPEGIVNSYNFSWREGWILKRQIWFVEFLHLCTIIVRDDTYQRCILL